MSATERSALTTPLLTGRGERKGSLRKKDKLRDINKRLDNVKLSEENEERRKTLSRNERADMKFNHSVYDKAAIMFEQLNEGKNITSTSMPAFDNEFEKRRAFSLAFSAKRYEAVLKDVLLDSSFYSRYFKLETFHHSKVMVMLLDFYEHGFRFSESKRLKIADSQNFLSYIDEIQKAFFDQKIKICSAFARNRIKACALTLEGLLPAEVKERGVCGARHPLHARVNNFLTDRETVMDILKQDGFRLVDELWEEDDVIHDEVKYCFAIDKDFDDLLVFPASVKDDIYNHDLALSYQLIPQSKARFIAFELVKNKLQEISRDRKKAEQMIPSVTGGTFKCPVGDDVILTDLETGSLAAHLCWMIHPKKKLIMCGCPSNKKVEVESRLRKMGAANFLLISENFIDIATSDERFSDSKVVICNPPSTNSGVVNPVDFILHEGTDAAQSLYKIASKGKMMSHTAVQKSTVRNALKIPSVESVLYSTFSVNKEENADVIASVLKEDTPTEDDEGRFSLQEFIKETSPSLYNKYEQKLMEEVSHQMVLPPTSEMNGFYLAWLGRKVKEASVSEIMERVNKKGLLGTKKKEKSAKKKTRKTDSPKFVRKRSESSESRSRTGSDSQDQRFRF